MSLKACITLDLEPDHASFASGPEQYSGWETSRIKSLLSVLRKYQVPLTIFVVAGSLSKKPEVINLFKKHKAEFHLHSFSHSIKEPDSEKEIKKGKEAFVKFFGKSPLGYRAPVGKISKKGWKKLADKGFYFDASIFPTFWPNPKNITLPIKPFKLREERIWEIPFSVVSRLRIPLTLSYMKLMGWKIFKIILERCQLLDTLVFGCHLHDFWRLPAYKNLSPLWKLVYVRNPNRGLYILEQFLKFLRNKNYNFVTMGELVKNLEKNK